MAVQFDKIGDNEYHLDICGYTCPHPQMYTKKSLEKMAEGDIVTVVFDNPSSKETIVQMCEQAGHDILEQNTEGGKIRLKIEKG